MAKTGVIPTRLRKCRITVCSVYMYAKITRKLWRGKQTLTYEPKLIKEPGAVVSVNQLVSPTPGFIAQMIGRLTAKKYKYATIFLDQASRI